MVYKTAADRIKDAQLDPVIIQKALDVADKIREQIPQQTVSKEFSEPIKQRLKSKRLVDIVNTHYDDLMQPVNGLIAEGVTLLAGQSKIGKSFLVHNMCLAVAAGKPFLGHSTLSGHVLYMALEDSERRLKHRTKNMCNVTGLEVSPLLECQIDPLTVKNGLLEMLDTWIIEHQPCRMIVIDVLQMVRGSTGSRANMYEADCEFIKCFKAIAYKHHVAIVLVHHLNRRSDSDDPFDRISGSNGLMGTADSAIILTRKRGKTEGALTFTGRDLYGDDLVLDFQNSVWHVISTNAGEYDARKRYDDNELVKLIKALLQDNSHGIRMSYVDVLKESLQRFNVYVANSSKDLSRQIKTIADDLLYYDDIEVSTGETLTGNVKGIEIKPKLIIKQPTEKGEQTSL